MELGRCFTDEVCFIKFAGVEGDDEFAIEVVVVVVLEEILFKPELGVLSLGTTLDCC